MRGGKYNIIETFKLNNSVELAALESQRRLLLLPALLKQILGFLAPALFIALFVNIFLFVGSSLGLGDAFTYTVFSVFGLIVLALVYALSSGQISQLSRTFPQLENNKLVWTFIGMLFYVLMVFALYQFLIVEYIKPDAEAIFIFFRLFLGLVALMLIYLLLGRLIKPYKDRYINLVLSKFISEIDPEGHFNKEPYLNQAIFESGQIYRPQHIWHYKGAHHIQLRIGNNLVEASELSVMQKKVSSDAGSKKVEVKDLFKGLYFFSAAKAPPQSLLIDHDQVDFANSKVYLKLADLSRPEYNLLAKESNSSAFNIYLKTGTLSSVELSDEFFAALEALSKVLSTKFSLSVQSNGVHLAVPNYKLLDDSIIFQPVGNFAAIKQIFTILQLFDKLRDLYAEDAIRFV